MAFTKREYLIKDLPTKSVTLYPSRAHIVRDIDQVPLRPGQNEIEIYGLTPTVDEQSVLIDGKGAATITDITVELVPNREIFEELYPKEDEEPQVEQDVIAIEDCEEVKHLKAAIETLKLEENSYKETINSAQLQLEILNGYSKTLKADKIGAQDVVQTISMYESQRDKIFKLHVHASEKLKKTQTSITDAEKQMAKAGREDRKRYEERRRAHDKEIQRNNQRQNERRNQANRIREERLKFFPKKVYKVTVNLEIPLNIETPNSSRRGSIDSVTLAPSIAPEPKDKAAASVDSDDTTVSLSLSYVTRDAHWTPRYDISVSSVQKSAIITYRAELVNGTSETWKDTQLILSTSQTSYGGLEDKVPVMHPWHVKLSRGYEQGLLSPEEVNQPRGYNAHMAVPISRNELFGSSQDTFTWGSKKQQMVQQQQYKSIPQVPQQQVHSQHYSSHRQMIPAPAAAAASGGSLFGSQNNSNGESASQASNTYVSNSGFGLFGNGPATSPSGLFGMQRNQANSSAVAGFGSNNAGSTYGNIRAAVSSNVESSRSMAHRSGSPSNRGLLDRGETIDALAALEVAPTSQESEVEYQESTWEDDGLTSTYEVPGTRTLAPSSLARRHKIVLLKGVNIHLSHAAVPKLRASAFLRAKVRNPSNTVTLLKGVAGVTLDSSFMGNTNLGRVAPGQVFDLPLGVDPAVSINYPKPSVHRSTQGLFSKESNQVYSRNVWITNSKNTPVELLVMDQIPVSEDEQLAIGIIEPRGLRKEGDVVRTGKAAREAASGNVEAADHSKWGKATAALKKDGHIAWTVNVEKKQACLLKLEYEAKMPAAGKIAPA